jgi:hypothetical protein
MRNSIRGQLAVMLLGACLAGCGGGGDSSPPPPSSGPPPPPPAPGTVLPPLAATAVDLSDNHTVGAAHWSAGNTSEGGSGSPVQGIECMDPPVETYHVHSHLSIILNGEALAVPGQVGVVSTGPGTDCHYEIHTHDSSGKVHVEAPAEATFTLGNLFAIWGQPLEASNIAGLSGMPVHVYIVDNGVVSEVENNWADIELRSHRLITIAVGTAITEIPNFTWNGN